MSQREQEKTGLARTLHHLCDMGWCPHKVDDGEELILVGEASIDEVVDACSAVDECTLYLRDGTLKGTLFLVWGNSPEELIADHSECNGFGEAVDQALARAFPDPEPVPTVDELVQQVGDYWASHPEHPRDDWQYQVACDETLLGYWDWVRARIEARQ